MEVNHVRSHQDKKKRKEQLTMAENLNIMADKIIEKNASIPKSIHIQNTPMSVYIQENYIPNRKYVLIVEPKMQLGSSKKNIDGHNKH